MAVIFGALLGFTSSLVPEISKYLLDKKDKAHELAILRIQLESSKNQIEAKRDALLASQELARHDYIYRPTAITWIDAINGLVRPIVTLLLIGLYVAVRIMSYPEDVSIPFWTEEDSTLLTAVVTYYFGQRSVSKI